MRVAKLTALRHGDIQKVAESVCPKNLVTCYREENKHDSSGVAYRCECKGVVIGYLPDLKTLGQYYADASTEQKRASIKEWGQAVRAIRDQFTIDFDLNGLEEWSGRVANILYNKDDQWLEFIDFHGQEGFKLRQIAVSFDWVEAF